MSTDAQSHEQVFAGLLRRIRLVALIHSAENAGLAPLSVRRLHAFAYLSNALAPVWDMRALDGKLLKRRGGAFYPSLQRDLDRLVGMGVVTISGLAYVLDEEERWRLEGSYRLNRDFANPLLKYLARFDQERLLLSFLQELAIALSALSDEEMEAAVVGDANYSDPRLDFGDVVDFAEWQQRNYSAVAATEFESLLPAGDRATRGEELHLYVRHLQTRLHGGR